MRTRAILALVALIAVLLSACTDQPTPAFLHTDRGAFGLPAVTLFSLWF